MKSINQLLEDMKANGLIYDPLITSMIINYEGGHLVRNVFYASMIGEGASEQQRKAGYLANARVELADLIAQSRILAAVFGWDYNELLETGQAKIEERTADYQSWGVRPNEVLLAHLTQTMNAPLHELHAPPSTQPPRKTTPRRDGD